METDEEYSGTLTAEELDSMEEARIGYIPKQHENESDEGECDHCGGQLKEEMVGDADVRRCKDCGMITAY